MYPQKSDKLFFTFGWLHGSGNSLQATINPAAICHSRYSSIIVFEMFVNMHYQSMAVCFRYFQLEAFEAILLI